MAPTAASPLVNCTSATAAPVRASASPALSYRQTTPAALPLKLATATGLRGSLTTARTALPGRGGSSGGAGVLERPGFDRSGDYADGPRTEEGGEMGKLKDRLRNGGGDRYRVLLLDHESHSEEKVAKLLPAAVPSVGPDEARGIFQESRQLGAGLVTLAIKEHAEFYAMSMAMKGLRSTIQPDGSVL